MNDLKTLTAAPTPITVDGETYEAHPLTLDDWGLMQAWVDTQFPSALDVATRAIEQGRAGLDDEGRPTRVPYTRAQQEFLLAKALELGRNGRKLVGTPEADEKVQSLDGMKELIFLAIRKGRPGFTRDDAARLYARMNLGHLAQLERATTADRVLSDPKAGTDGTATATTPA